jgi:amidase
MKSLCKDQCVLEYNLAYPPVLKVTSGETFQLETPSILTHMENFPKSITVPVTGPVYVQAAHPGSALKADILEICLDAGEGVICAIPGKGAFGDRILKPECKVVKHDEKYVYFNDNLRLPLRPMVGKIGVAPQGKGINCNTPGAHGGNMDITDITDGASVYFPVFIEGALFAAGDVHAVMADGESIISAVESESVLTLRCEVVTNLKLTHPLVVNKGFIMTVGDGNNLEEAYHVALDNMAALLIEYLGLSFVDTAMLISQVADIKVNQIVNPRVGVRVAFPRALLPAGSMFGPKR